MRTPKKAKKAQPTAKLDLTSADLGTLVLVLLLHQNNRMDAMAKLPAPSSGELMAFSRQQDRLTKLRERLEKERDYLEM